MQSSVYRITQQVLDFARLSPLITRSLCRRTLTSSPSIHYPAQVCFTRHLIPQTLSPRPATWFRLGLGSMSSQHLTSRRMSFGSNLEMSAVETELERLSEGKEVSRKVKEQQLALFQALTKDISEPTPALVAKLNCETELSPADVYNLAIAVFEARNHVTETQYLTEVAAGLFGHAGEQGDHNALYTYAQLLRTGQGVQVDLAKAAEMLRELSLKGHPYAQFALAGMYYSGSGVTQSFQKAYTLYKVSSQNYVPQAFNVLGNMHRHGQGVEVDLEQAVEYYQKGCEFGDPLAHINMAHCYTHGKGVELSLEKAFENYVEASKSNNPLALYNVGTHYFSGQGVPQNLKKAAEYYEKASILGFTPAQVNLGNMYYDGMGVAKDRAKAKELFKMAAERDENAKSLLEWVEKEELEQEGGGSGDTKP